MNKNHHFQTVSTNYVYIVAVLIAFLGILGFSSGIASANIDTDSTETASSTTITATTTDIVVHVKSNVIIPTRYTVTIDKFIDGAKATETNVNGVTFPMTSSWFGVADLADGSGTYTLSPSGWNSSNPYEAITDPLTSYSTNENTTGPVVGSDCISGAPFALVGYSSGLTLVDATNAAQNTTSPNFTDLANNEYVIVWNKTCSTSTSTPTVVHTIIYTAGANGTLTGSTTQTVNNGSDGITVTAVPNVGFHFVDWSDASTTSTRIDTNITSDHSFTANFGADTIGPCNLEIEKTVDKQSAVTNDALVFTITFRNTGTENCTGSGVRIEDVLDQSLSYVSESHSDNVIPGYNFTGGLPEPVYNEATKLVLWSAGILKPNDSGWVKVNANVQATSSCTYDVKNQAKVTSYEYSNFTQYVNSNVVETSVRNAEYCASSPENTPPIITILGDNPFTLNINTVFTDPGATATDTEDGNITSHIIASSTVATSTIGSYTVTYTVTDSGGLTATSTRTVNVVEPHVDAVVQTGGGGSNGNSGSSSGGGSYIGFGGDRNKQLLAITNTGEIKNSPTSCILLNSYLRYGYNNDPTEVVKLQAFLKRIEGYDVDVNGVFDNKTLAGVNAFQTKFLDNVMGPWGASQSSGYVYITTKKKVNQIACNVAFIINPAEQSIINSYKAAQASIPAPAPELVPATTETTNPTNSTTSPDIGVKGTSSDTALVGGSSSVSNTVNTASVANTSAFNRFWGFVSGIFKR